MWPNNNKILVSILALFLILLSPTLAQQYRQQNRRSGNPNPLNQRILKILEDSQKDLEDTIHQISLTNGDRIDDFYGLTAVLNKFRLSLIRLTRQWHSIETPQDFYAELNSTEITQNLRTLDLYLNPDYDRRTRRLSQSVSSIWTELLDLLASVDYRQTTKGGQSSSSSSEPWTVSSWTESFKKFITFLNDETYGWAVLLNEEMTNNTKEVGKEFLDDVNKLDLRVPKRPPYGKDNVSVALAVEKEEEGNDLKLKTVYQILLGRSDALERMMEELTTEKYVGRFATIILNHRPKLSRSTTPLVRLNKISARSNGRNGIEIEISENFGNQNSPLKRDEEWMKGFEKLARFYRNKLGDIETRERDRNSWKATQDYQRVVAERERQERIVLGSYDIQCKTGCVKNKDYFYCVNGSKWDYCSPQAGRDYKNKTCVDGCGFKGYGYKWCRVVGDSWGYCSTF